MWPIFGVASLLKSETQSDEQALRELTYRWSLRSYTPECVEESL
jgi:hypothetical protein